MTAPTAPTLDVDALRSAQDPVDALAHVLADDVEWIEIDQRTQPSAPAVCHGRDAVLGMIREAAARGIESRVTDGFAAGDRAAMTVTCTNTHTNARIVCNALVDLRDGKIARFFAVQAWDD